MTPDEIIKGLEGVKAWEPREFIVAACDAAIAYIRDHEQAKTLIAESAAPLIIPMTDNQVADAAAGPDVNLTVPTADVPADDQAAASEMTGKRSKK